MNTTLRQFSVLATYIIMVALNIAANLVPFNNQTTAEISDRYPTLFTPAGYVFSIWGVIYIALAVFTVYQALPSQRSSRLQASIGWWMVLANVFNSIWIFVWHYNYLMISVAMTVGLLVSLLIMYTRLHLKPVAAISEQQRWLTSRPISLYLGWASVASIANGSVVLYSLSWNGFGLTDVAWTWIMSVIAVVLAIAMILRHRDYIFAAVIAWALVGIAVKFI